ncbi:MAG: WD40/YVTN/BNR-like repeat-containing protein, partial [Planctomycetota bacterium]
MRRKPLLLLAPGAGLLGLLLLGSPGADPPLDDEETARALAISLEDVRALRASKGLTDADFLAMPEEVLERARRKLHLPKPDSPDEWATWRLSFWRDENGEIPENALIGARAQFEALASLETAGGLSAGGWAELGPGNIGGRVRSILPHPTDPDTLFAGSVSGGIWKTTDGGSSWSAVDDFMGNLAVTSLILLPSNPSVMYAATGEGFFNGDAIQGAGIFQSLDGGTTWTQLVSTANASFQWVNRLALSPDESTLLAATGSGIWRSPDGGASWSAAFTGPDRRSLDVDFHPTNPSLAVAHFIDFDAANSTFFTSGLRSTDGGNSWTEASGLHVNSSNARVELAYHRGWTGAGNGCVYALQATGGGTLKRSLDGGATYSVVSSVSQGSAGWYYNALWIDPTDLDASTADDVMIFGGLDLYRSANGGASFAKISQWYSWPASAHADHHAIVEAPGFDGTSDRTVYFGNDGGVWKADDVYAVAPLSGWVNLNNQLAITQGYGGSRSPVSGAVILGTQDNGT